MSDFARLASFEGRAGRSTFWWAIVGAALVLFAPITTGGVLLLLNLPGWNATAVLDGPEAGWATWQQAASAAYLVAVLPTLWLLFAALVRRCHDRNWSGFFLLVGLIPVVQIWALVELGLLAGTPGDNGFGPSPEASPETTRDQGQPMRLEPLTADTVLEPFPVDKPAPALDPFAPSVERPLPEYRFDDAPLTLDSAPEAVVQPRKLREGRVPIIIAPLVKYARFDGRATRSEYWLFMLMQWVLLVGVAAVLLTVLPPERGSAPLVALGVIAVMIGLFLPNLAVTSRRLHDSGLSFAWWLLTFIPLIGWLVNLVLVCLGGTRGENAYGPNPRDA